MHCIDWRGRAARRRIGLALALLLSACATPQPQPQPPATQTGAPAKAPVKPPPAPAAAAPAPAAPVQPHTGVAPPAEAKASVTAPRPPRYVKLGRPETPRNDAELKLQMARRLVAAHPDTSYQARAPDHLLAIPVLEIELNADGSVRHIHVLRKPSTGNQATQLAIEAVHRAAPYGDLAKLPRPWKVVETFLFNDDLHFKPRTLDLD